MGASAGAADSVEKMLTAEGYQVTRFVPTNGWKGMASSTPEILEALLDKLHGRSEFVGKSPVDAFCGL